jgi:hypothetical protein
MAQIPRSDGLTLTPEAPPPSIIGEPPVTPRMDRTGTDGDQVNASPVAHSDHMASGERMKRNVNRGTT